MAASFVTVIIWKFSEIDIDPIFFAMGINCAFLLGCHYLFNEPGGWITVQDLSEPKDDKMSCLRNFRSYLSFNFYGIVDGILLLTKCHMLVWEYIL